MENPWITFGAAVVGAIVGAAITAWFTRLEEKRKARIEAENESTRDAIEAKKEGKRAKTEAAKAILPFLSLILNRSAPDTQRENTAELIADWARQNRFLHFNRVPEDIRIALDEKIVAYLTALQALDSGAGQRAEVERTRDLAIAQVTSFSEKMDI
jgi:L-lactate permease